MSKLRTLLIDDEKNNLDNLEQLLIVNCPGVEIVGTAMNAVDGKTAVLQHQPDLLFLDIQMPDKSGFDLLRDLAAYDFEVIFVTAYDQYAIQAIKFAAVDYLLKPINPAELQQAVDRSIVKSRQKNQNLELKNLLQLLHQQKETHRIALTTLKETRFIRTTEIVRCESSNNYSIFFLASGEKLTVSTPIYEYEELLTPYGFIRSHQSHLVNKDYIKSWIKEDGGYLLLDTGDQVPVSRNKKEMVIRAMDQWKGKK
jgi:two-component system, LytTR family, response regulator